MANSLGNYLLNNILNEIKDDVIKLISKDKQVIYVHKCIARKSSFINLLLNEHSDNSILEINLDYNTHIIDTLRDYIYDIKIIIKNDNFKDLFYLADYLSISELCEYILDWLFRYNLHPSNAISCYKFIKNSSYKESKYYEKINLFIDKNLNDILFKNEIKLLSINEYLSFIHPELNTKLLFNSFKFWSENSNIENTKKNFKKILDQNILIPGLIDINDLFNDFFPYLNKLNIPINDSDKLLIIELSNFRKGNYLYNKNDYDRYIWAMNLKEGEEIDFKDNCSYKWLTGIITECKLIERNSIFNNNLIIKIKYCNKVIEFILPDDINNIDNLHNHTIEWRKQLDVNMIINFYHDETVKPAKIINKQGDEIIILTSDKFLYKINIYSKDIFTSNMIFLDLFEEIKLKPINFKDIEFNTKISHLLYIDNE